MKSFLIEGDFVEGVGTDLDFEVFFVEVFSESRFSDKFGTEIEVILTGGSFGGEVSLDGDVEVFKVVVNVDLIGFYLVVYVGEFEFLLISKMGGWIVVVLFHLIDSVFSEPGVDKGFGLNKEVILDG